MLANLKEFRDIRKYMLNNEEANIGVDLQGKRGKRLKKSSSSQNKGSRGQSTAVDSDLDSYNNTENVDIKEFRKIRKYMLNNEEKNLGVEPGKRGKRLKTSSSSQNKGSRGQSTAADSDMDSDNNSENVDIKEFRKIRKYMLNNEGKNLGVITGKRGKRLKTSFSSRNKSSQGQSTAVDSDMDCDSNTEYVDIKEFKEIRKYMLKNEKRTLGVEPGKRGKCLKTSSSSRIKGSRVQSTAVDLDMDSENNTENVATAEDASFVEHPQMQRSQPQHNVRSSSSSLPLSSEITSQSPPQQSPIRRSFKQLKQSITKSLPQHSVSTSPPKLAYSIKKASGAQNKDSTDSPPAEPSEGAQLRPADAVMQEVMEGQGPRQMTNVRQQAQQPLTGQGDKKHIPPEFAFNPSKPRHTWPCGIIPLNVPCPGTAQSTLHPRKDVFVLKVAKVKANGDRRVKMELELVTPKYGKKLPYRMDTREAQCEPCPCSCNTSPKLKKKHS